MTVVLDGKTLETVGFQEAEDPVKTERDAWQNSAYKREVKNYGLVRRWQLTCLEKDVAWIDSQVKSFQETAEDGTPVAFVVTDEQRVINTTVYILSVSLSLPEVGGKNIRYFTLMLQEA